MTTQVMESLASLKKGERAAVIGMNLSTSTEQLAVQTRLLELGFAPGETVRVVAEAFPGRDPLAVRVGNATFALRRAEAELIRIRRLV